MQAVRDGSLRRRGGAALLSILAIWALAEALVTGDSPAAPKPSATARVRPTAAPINTDGPDLRAVSGRPAVTQSLPVLVIPPGRPSVHVPILMYHYIRVNPDPTDELGFNLSVTPSDFHAQLDWLARNGYHPIDLEDLRGYLLSNRPLPEKPVVITLDDGYRDLYTAAYPLLRAHRFKAVAYIVSGFLGRPANVTADQVVEMNASGIEIGSHTVTHVDLSKASPAELHRQVTDSRAALEALLGHPVLDFCYPSGAVDPAVVQAVAAAGYQSATTTAEGTLHSGADRYLWGRVRVAGGEDLSEFAARLGREESPERGAGNAEAGALTATPPLRPPLTHGAAGETAPPGEPIAEALTP